jgi:hypothetical protein
MKMKRPSETVSYRPGEQVRKFITEYCPKGGGLSRSQLLDVAMKFLMMRRKEEIDQIILGVMTGRLDQKGEKERAFFRPGKKAG